MGFTHRKIPPNVAYRKSNQNHIRWKRLRLPKRSTSTIGKGGWISNPVGKNIRQVRQNGNLIFPKVRGEHEKMFELPPTSAKNWAPKNIDIENKTWGVHAKIGAFKNYTIKIHKHLRKYDWMSIREVKFSLGHPTDVTQWVSSHPRRKVE